MTWYIRIQITTPGGKQTFTCDQAHCLLDKGKTSFCKHCPIIIGTVKLPVTNRGKEMEGGIPRLRGS